MVANSRLQGFKDFERFAAPISNFETSIPEVCASRKIETPEPLSRIVFS
jgi:hypothetical protein